MTNDPRLGALSRPGVFTFPIKLPILIFLPAVKIFFFLQKNLYTTRFYHGYYRSYCYLPLYIFCGEHLLCARLRPSNRDASTGSVEDLSRIVGRIRECWPEVHVIVRGDADFSREPIMRWCEDHGVDYVFGLARNERLVKRIAKALRRSHRCHVATGLVSRRFRQFRYRTRKSWSRSRRVVAKAEHLAKGSNPRLVVTSLSSEVAEPQRLYEQLYCARRHEKPHRGAAAGPVRRPNQFGDDALQPAAVVLRIVRLCLEARPAAARCGGSLPAGTHMAKVQCETLRTKLLKVAARKVWLSFPSVYPLWNEFVAAATVLCRGPARAPPA